MNKYVIGNTLRGWFVFEAENHRAAWEEGRIRFNKSFPSTGKGGRGVELRQQIKRNVPSIDPKNRKDYIGVDEVLICAGYTGYPWKGPRI